MKYHTTIRITRKLLESLYACPTGIRDVNRFLPATLSTDPHENFELAERLIVADVTWRLSWLSRHVSDYQFFLTVCYEGRDMHDGWVVAQWLAGIADYVATKAGR